GGGGGEVERVDAAAGLVDGVAAQGGVGVEAVDVIAGAADERVVAGAARDRVVAGAAVDERGGQVRRARPDQLVVAAHAEDLNQPGIGGGGGPALDRHEGGVTVAHERPSRVAGDREVVVQVIARDRQHPLCGGERGRDRRQDAAIQQLEAGEFGQGDSSRSAPAALATHEKVNQLAL